ncbi:unnamed protein product [Heterobilharzia americana]|nr:unnamed protein product [Heterobilharzia americana]
MLYGVTPFYSETLVNTYANIMNHVNSLKFPENVNVSEACLNFMKSLLCDRTERLGSQAHCLSEVYNHPWFSADWIQSQQTDGHLDSMDISIADWTWSNIRACRAPFQPHLRSETDTSYFQPETDDEEDDDACSGGVENTIEKSNNDEQTDRRNSQTKDANDNAKYKIMAKGDFPESSSSDHKYSGRCSDHLLELPGSQLAFAGFSFSSPHPHHLALLSGLHLTPLRGSSLPTTTTTSSDLLNGKPDSTHVTTIGHHHTEDKKSGSSKNSHATTCESVSNLINNENENISDSRVNHTSCESLLTRLRIQLEDALTLSDTHLSEVTSLTVQLEQATARYRELENKISLQEMNFKKTNEEMKRQLENAHAEAAASCSRLEAEIIKWKSLAQSEEAARQSAETAGNLAVATATAKLARRAAEVVDRLGRPGARNSLSRVVSPGGVVVASDPSNLFNSSSYFDSNFPSDHSDVDAPDDHHLRSLDNPSSATELLISRMEEMAKRAHCAEAAAQEAADQLEAEKHFSRLYKETCAEKSDQLSEKTRELELLREQHAKSCKAYQRACEKYKAALRALNEEQQKSTRYLEAAQSAKESVHAATQRATCASSEVAQLRVELERMTQAYGKEQAKCAATVNKLTEVMSGKNLDTLELMWLASFQQEQDNSGRIISPFSIGCNSARSKVASLKGLGQQKRMNLLLKQPTLRKEYENKLRLNESHTMSIESELTSLKEQLRSISMARSSPSQQDIDDESSGLRHHQQHGLHNHHHQNYYYHQQQQQQQNFRKPLLGKQIYSSDSCSSLANNNGNNLDCDSTLRKHLALHVLVLLYPPRLNHLFRTNLLGTMTVNTCSVGNSRNSTEMLPSSIASPIDDPVITNFKFYGILEVEPKRGKRNKLHWESCFAQLTRSHLMLWDIPSDLCKRVHELQNKYIDVSNFVASTINSNSNSLNSRLEMPLNALYHVRSVNSCDVCHERVEDLPRVFQIIFDRQRLNNNNNNNKNTGITNGNSSNIAYNSSGIKQSSSGNSVLGGLSSSSSSGDSANLPRKSSLGSTAIFSTSSQHPANSRRVVRTNSASGSHAHSVSNSTNTNINKRSNHIENSTPGHSINPLSDDSAHNAESSTIYTRGHVLQRILFRSVFHPPLAYQCTDCQIKLHAYHLESNDYPLPQCAKAVGVCLLRARTVQDKEQWIEYMLLAMKVMKSLSSTPNPTIRKSNNVEVPVSSAQQQQPIATTPRSISSHGCNPLHSMSPSVPPTPASSFATPIRYINLTPPSDHQISHARSKSSVFVQDSLKSHSRAENSSANSSNEFSSLSHQSHIPPLISYPSRPTFTPTTIINNNNNYYYTATSVEAIVSSTSPTTGTVNNHENQMSRSFTLGLTKYRSEDYADCAISYTNDYPTITAIRSISVADSSNCNIQLDPKNQQIVIFHRNLHGVFDILFRIL